MTNRDCARTLAGRRCRVNLAYLVLCLALTPLVAGCSGCSKDPASEEEREAKREELKKKEKPEPDFELLRFSTQPRDLDKSEAGIKPGHWTSAIQEMRANNFDFHGELATEFLYRGMPVDLDQMPFRLRIARPAVLPKGQRRLMEFPLFTPEETDARQLQVRLLTGPGGRPVMNELQPLQRMPAHQNYVVVLSSNPSSYVYLRGKLVDSIRAVTAEFKDDIDYAHYRVMLPRIRTRAPLPSGALNWTMIAYIIWDDIDPKSLSTDQQQALVDWLHWGGQLIVSGPGSLDTLQGSFLEAYLPAVASGAWELKRESLSELIEGWNRTERTLSVVRPWSGVKLEPHSTAQLLVGSAERGPLVVERQVGRGRVVATAFRLNQRELRDWPSFDGFFNACLLRRAPRRFFLDEGTFVAVTWDEGNAFDPTRTSRLRYFSRDAEAPLGLLAQELRTSAAPRSPATEFADTSNYYMGPSDPLTSGPPVGRGVAGWNDLSAVSDLARWTLREAAGIVVPDAMFVVWVLGVYIAVLVPLNWAFFKLLGRVELAWAAAPMIAVACAVAVVWLAQLDIGFARSRTELTVIETQPDYQRAHATRYTALYSSLGTSYDLRFDDDTAVALPFPTGQGILRGQGRTTVEFRRIRELASDREKDSISLARLDGLEISSNTTGMVHSEQMVDLGGAFHWEALPAGRYRLTNNTMLTLEGAGIVSRDEGAWIGKLAPGAAVDVELAPMELNPHAEKRLWADQLAGSPVTALLTRPEGLNLHHLLVLAHHEVGEGELRLVAWTDDELGGLTIEPAASQARHRGLVVAHLRYEPDPAPVPDVNTRADAQRELGKPLEPEDISGQDLFDEP